MAAPNIYLRTAIYKLSCIDPDVSEIYIGSTTNIQKRLNQHKCGCTNPYNPKHNYKLYRYIRDNQGWARWRIDVIELFPCNSKIEAAERERFWIQQRGATLNCQLPARTAEEKRIYSIDSTKRWMHDNREHWNEYMRNYSAKKRLLQKLMQQAGAAV